LRSEPVDGGPVRLLFAGTFEGRKGADDLVAALGGLPDVPWRLEIAGPISSGSRETHRRFLSDSRVSVLGTLPRTRLAEVMAANEIFIFPSLAEGSARVVFEALASGLYVITTPTSGSIVQDGIHGTVVSPRSPEKLSDAIRRAAADRATTHSVGCSNAEIVRASYRQTHYGQALLRLYERLESEAPLGSARGNLSAFGVGVSG
jgi:glycosyltransferase involved in cell wall biosynthesis